MTFRSAKPEWPSRTITLPSIELHYALGALREFAKHKCNKSNCGTVCLCGPCSARRAVPFFEPAEAAEKAAEP